MDEREAKVIDAMEMEVYRTSKFVDHLRPKGAHSWFSSSYVKQDGQSLLARWMDYYDLAVARTSPNDHKNAEIVALGLVILDSQQLKP